MPIIFMPARSAVPRYTVFGKLPRRADFVRIGDGAAVVREFDELLARSLAYASRQPDWDEAQYLAGGACDFQFTSDNGRECFTGVLHPSHDEAGRLFPLVAGAILSAPLIVPHTPELTIANELFFSGLREQLASAVAHAVDLVACRQFLDIWITPNPYAEDDIGLAAQILTRHLNRANAALWHAALIETGQGGLDDCLLAHLFQDSAARRGAAPVLLPLSATQGEDTLDQAAWLALYRAASGCDLAPDYLCLSRSGRRTLIVSPGRLHERSLAPVWGMAPEPAADAASWRQHPAQARAAWALARQLQDPAPGLAPLIDTLARIVRGLAAPPRNPPFPFSFIN
ncbi:MAG: type VI secretion system-associated protein TagF [Azoarcus sp.]|jgi:type VI secretion system protein ImpM|nr:type VI secretion system-associated protein TagF [Azoarcus sp.]